MWHIAIRDASSRRYGFAMTWVQSQWNTQRGGSHSTASSLPWVALSVYSFLFLSVSLPNDIYILTLSRSDLRYHRRDVHGGRHHWLLHIHGLWSLEENPDWENVMSTHNYVPCLLFMPAKPLHTRHYTLLLWPTLTGKQLYSLCAHLDRLVFISKHLIQWITGISFGAYRWFPYFAAILIHPQLS